MSGFAKVFGDGDDQILVVLDVDADDGPEIRVTVRPAGLGLCDTVFRYTSEDAAAKAFTATTEEVARKATRWLLEQAAEIRS